MLKTITIRVPDRTYEILQSLAKERGKEVEDFLVDLVYEYIKDQLQMVSLLEKRVSELESRVSRLEQEIKAPTRAEVRAKKVSMKDIISERKVQLLSEMRIRKPESFIRKARSEGIVVLESEGGDVAFVDPEFWSVFKEKLPYIPRDIEEAELSKEERKLMNFLIQYGFIVWDSRKRKWREV